MAKRKTSNQILGLASGNALLNEVLDRIKASGAFRLEYQDQIRIGMMIPTQVHPRGEADFVTFYLKGSDKELQPIR